MPPFLVYFFDLVFVLAGAWILACATIRNEGGALGFLLGFGVYGVGIVAGSGVVLGAIGCFTPVGFLSGHLLLAAMLVWWRRRHLSDYVAGTRWRIITLDQTVNQDWRLRWGALGLLMFLGITAYLAAAGEPAIYDSLTYRLSRIAHWLQEARIGFISTNDPRQNYMPLVPDIVMAWLLGATREGYAGLALAQWWGGVLLLLATIGIGRQAGLGRAGSMGAALLVAGMANVAVQFTTNQTDLFTAGLVACAYYFFVAGIREQRGSVIAGLAAGMALGSKGTVFYFLPSLLIWACWHGWHYRLSIRGWLVTILSAVVALLVFVVPGLVRNQLNYGNVFGPPAFVAMHHQGGKGEWVKKVFLNLQSSLIQSCEPHSQLPGLQALGAGAGLWMTRQLPASDPFVFENADRREVLTKLMLRKTPDADGATFGLLPLLLAGCATVSLVLGPRVRGVPSASLLRATVLGLVVFAVYFHFMQQWHPYGFRYFVVAAPWLAVLIAYWIEQRSLGVRRAIWSVALFSSVCVAGQTLAFTHNAAWPAVVRPEKSATSYVYLAWREWLSELPPAGDTLHVALPFNRELAPFYRRTPPQKINLVPMEDLGERSAEEVVGDLHGEWLITTPYQFADREGRVVRRTWLFQGDATSPYSLVAYRTAKAADSIEEP